MASVWKFFCFSHHKLYFSSYQYRCTEHLPKTTSTFLYGINLTPSLRRFKFKSNHSFLAATAAQEVHLSVCASVRLCVRNLVQSSRCQSVKCKMHFTRCTLQDALCKMHFARCTLQDALCKMHFARCIMQDALCKMHFARCTLQDVLCKIHFARCTLQCVCPVIPPGH